MKTWSDGQARALALARAGANVAILGAGGVGKSTLISEIVRVALADGRTIAVTSSTGCSSNLLCQDIKGVTPTTVHRVTGLGTGGGTIASTVAWVRRFWPAKMWWIKTDTLIVDEISMISDDFFEKLDAVARNIRGEHDRRKASKPFGGMQIIVSGDFHQLPPVRGGFAFMSEAFKKCFPPDRHAILRQNFRQDGTDGYLRITSEARFGRLSEESFEALATRLIPADVDLENEENPPPTIVPLRSEATAINGRRMARLAGKTVRHHAAWAKGPKVSEKKGRSSHEYMLKKFPGEECLKLKVGTKVMFLVNLPKEGLHNGLAGIVVAFTPTTNFPIVDFDNGMRHTVTPHSWDAPDSAGELVQIPLILAWALTIHKAQGAQFVRLRVNAGDRIFEAGQGYVGISRVKLLKDIEFTELHRDSFRASPEVTRYYRDIYRALRGPASPKVANPTTGPSP